MIEMVLANAGKVAHRYARRCTWTTYDDLRHEAVRAQLEALNTYDPLHESGAPISAYLYIAGRYAVKRSVLSTSTAVSSRHDPRRLIGLGSTSIYRRMDDPDASDCASEEVPDVAHSNRYGVSYTHHEHFTYCVRRRLVELFGVDGAEFALLVLSGEWEQHEVADAHDVEQSMIYRIVGRMRRVIAADEELQTLWREHE